MTTLIVNKECLTCKKVIRGRSDKKFCNDYCRNVYNNSLKSQPASVVRKINASLLKNRKIILALLQDNQTVKVKKSQLIEFGFRFRFFTHRFKSQKGSLYSFCYEAGYLQMEDDWILLVKQPETVDVFG